MTVWSPSSKNGYLTQFCPGDSFKNWHFAVHLGTLPWAVILAGKKILLAFFP